MKTTALSTLMAIVVCVLAAAPAMSQRPKRRRAMFIQVRDAQGNDAAAATSTYQSRGLRRFTNEFGEEVKATKQVEDNEDKARDRALKDALEWENEVWDRLLDSHTSMSYSKKSKSGGMMGKSRRD